MRGFMESDIIEGELTQNPDDSFTLSIGDEANAYLNDRTREAAEKRRLIIADYRVRGITNQNKIKKMLREEYGIEVSQPTISQDLKLIEDYYKNKIANKVDEERSVDFGRIEVAVGAIMKKIMEDVVANNPPDLNAIKTLAIILERKSKMLGYDSPLKVDIRDIIIRRAEADGIDPLLALEAAGLLMASNVEAT